VTRLTGRGALFAEAADTTSAAFTDEIQRQGREELTGFGDAVRETAGASFAQIQASRAEVAQQTTSEQEEFCSASRGALSGALESGIGEAREKVQEGFAPLLESWKQMAEAHESGDVETAYGTEQSRRGTIPQPARERFELVDGRYRNDARQTRARRYGEQLARRRKRKSARPALRYSNRLATR